MHFLWSITLLEIQIYPYLSVTLWGKADSPSSGWQKSWAHKEMFLKTPAFFTNLPSAPSFCSHTAICDSSPHTASSSLILSVGSGKRAPNVSTRQRLLLLFSPFIIPLAGIINLVPWEHKEVNNTPPSCGRLSITNDEGAFGRQGDAADWSQGIRGALHDKWVSTRTDGPRMLGWGRACLTPVINMWWNTKRDQGTDQSRLVDVEIVVLPLHHKCVSPQWIPRRLNDSLVESDHPLRRPGGRHNAPVATAAGREQGCILAPQPNATLIFLLAILHSLFTACLFLSQAQLSVSVRLPPISHASPWPAAFWEAKDTVKRKNRSWDGSHSSQWPTLNS